MNILNKLRKNKVASAGLGYTVGNYLLKGINKLDEECLNEGNDLRLRHLYKFDKKETSILARNIKV